MDVKSWYILCCYIMIYAILFIWLNLRINREDILLFCYPYFSKTRGMRSKGLERRVHGIWKSDRVSRHYVSAAMSRHVLRHWGLWGIFNWTKVGRLLYTPQVRVYPRWRPKWYLLLLSDAYLSRLDLNGVKINEKYILCSNLMNILNYCSNTPFSYT